MLYLYCTINTPIAMINRIEYPKDTLIVCPYCSTRYFLNSCELIKDANDTASHSDQFLINCRCGEAIFCIGSNTFPYAQTEEDYYRDYDARQERNKHRPK